MDERQQLAELLRRLEHLLQLRGVIDENGEIPAAHDGGLPLSLEGRLEGVIETAAELRGLIEIGRAVRRGERLSAAVVSAANLMTAEVYIALDEDFQSSNTDVQ